MIIMFYTIVRVFTLLPVVSCIVFNNDRLSLYTFYLTMFHIRMPLEGYHGLIKCMYVTEYSTFGIIKHKRQVRHILHR